MFCKKKESHTGLNYKRMTQTMFRLPLQIRLCAYPIGIYFKWLIVQTVYSNCSDSMCVPWNSLVFCNIWLGFYGNDVALTGLLNLICRCADRSVCDIAVPWERFDNTLLYVALAVWWYHMLISLRSAMQTQTRLIFLTMWRNHTWM